MFGVKIEGSELHSQSRGIEECVFVVLCFTVCILMCYVSFCCSALRFGFY